MPDEVVGQAKIRIEPDLTGFDAALESGIQAAADQAAEALVASFRAAGETATTELQGIGSGLVDVTATADAAAGDIQAAFSTAADEADAALGTIGEGAADDVASSFEGTGEAIAADIEVGATEADAALQGIGAGAGDGVVDQFSGVGAQIADDVAQGAAEANAALAGIGTGIDASSNKVGAAFADVGDLIAGGVLVGTAQAEDGLNTLEATGSGVVGSLADEFDGLGKFIGLALGAVALGSVFSAGERVASIAGVTNTLIETTGNVANVSAEQVLALGDSLEGLTGVESELVQQGENVLLTFKNVRNEVGAGNDIFDRAIAAGADLGAVLGGDITGSALQLGKALQDPIRGLSLLGRAGVTFTDDQKELVRSLVEEGDLLSAQKVILGEVEGQVGGAAEAAAKASDRIRNSLGNITEEIGLGLLPAADDLADRLPAIVEDLAPAAQELGEALGEGLGVAVDAFLALSPLLGTTTELLTLLLPPLEVVVHLIDAIPDPVLQAAAAIAIMNSAGGALGPTITNLRTVAQISTAVASSRGLSVFATGLEAVKSSTGGLGATLKGLTTGMSGATLAAGLGLTAYSLWSQTIDEARASGEAFGDSIRQDFDLAAMSAEELAALSADVGTQVDSLRDKASDRTGIFFFDAIDSDVREEFKGAADELERFQDEVEAARKEMVRLEAETNFGPAADRFVGVADAIAVVRGESDDAASAIANFRANGDDADSTMLALAQSLGAAELSEEGMASAAQALGVDVDDLRTFIEDTTAAVDDFVAAAVEGLPQISDAFVDANESGKVSAQELIDGLVKQTLDIATFTSNLSTLVGAGFADVAGVLSEQGAEIGGAAAAQLATAAREGNTKLLEETRAGLDARDDAVAFSTQFLETVLGPEFVSVSGVVAENATAAFGDAFDPQEQVRIAGELASSGLDEEGQRVAAVAATAGEFAAQSFGEGLDLDQETIDAAIAAGKAISDNAPIGPAYLAGISTGAAFANGVTEGISNRQGAVNDKAEQLVLQAEAAARRAAQAKSPSKLFAELGADLGDGAAEGLDDSAKAVVAAAERIVADAAAAFSTSDLALSAPRLDGNGRSLAAAAVAVPTFAGGAGGATAGGQAMRPLIIEKLYLPSTEPELAASALIGGLVTITQVVGTR